MEGGPSPRTDHKMTLSGRVRGHVTHFRNFGTPYNFQTNQAIRFKYGIQIKDGREMETKPPACRP